MKKNYIILSAIVLTAGMFSFQKTGNEKVGTYKNFNHYNPGGITSAFAGAPTDANCTQCHSGTAQSGASVNTLTMLSGTTPVTSYTPSASYTVALTMSPNPASRGFQAVAMNSSNAIVGTASTLIGAHVTNNRATHSSRTDVAWTWTWVAPSTDVGNITFYVASMAAGGADNQTGDVVYLSQHVFGSTASISETVKDKYNFNAGYSSSNNSVMMDFNSLIAGQMYFNLVDLNGRSVFTYNMGTSSIGSNNEKIVLPEDLKNGMYVVNMFVNNNAMEQKIMIQK